MVVWPFLVAVSSIGRQVLPSARLAWRSPPSAGLAAVADDAAGLADVAELAGKLEHGELAPCYLLLRGHVVLRSRLDVLCNIILTPAGSGVATPGIAALGASGPSLRDARCGAICQVNTVSVQSIEAQVNQSPYELPSLFLVCSVISPWLNVGRPSTRRGGR